MPRYSAEEGLHLGTAQGRKSWDLLHNFLLKKTFSNCITTITSEIDYVDTAIITSIKQYTGLAGNFFLNTIFCQKHGTPTGRIVNFLRKSKQLGHQQQANSCHLKSNFFTVIHHRRGKSYEMQADMGSDQDNSDNFISGVVEGMLNLLRSVHFSSHIPFMGKRILWTSMDIGTEKGFVHKNARMGIELLFVCS